MTIKGSVLSLCPLSLGLNDERLLISTVIYRNWCHACSIITLVIDLQISGETLGFVQGNDVFGFELFDTN